MFRYIKIDCKFLLQNQKIFFKFRINFLDDKYLRNKMKEHAKCRVRITMSESVEV